MNPGDETPPKPEIVIIGAREFSGVMAQRIASIVAQSAAAGEGIGHLACTRATRESPQAAIVAVLGGTMTDADIVRFKEFYLAFMQDVAEGCKCDIRVLADELKPEPPKE